MSTTNNHRSFAIFSLGFLLCLSSISLAEESAAPKKIVLAGDSTVTDHSGWGVGFAKSLSDKATCVNLAKGGRSSKSFRDEGLWKQVLAEKPDYVLIQFGHNDMPGKGPARETDPKTTFRENLARYVDEARSIGAKPVIITSISRRLWDDQGKHIQSILGGYVEGAKAVAQEKNVPLIDLHTISIQVYEELGSKGCEKMRPKSSDGKIDRTHFNPAGSDLFGPLVASQLAKVLPETKPLVKQDLPTQERAIKTFRQAK
ncbi:pectin esterase [bacterium]|nr:pectin esterase [bacterium]